MSVVVDAPPSRRIKELEVMVADVVVETPDTSTPREPDVSICGSLVRKGRVNAALIRELVPDLDSCIVYVCGPGISKWDREAAKQKGEPPTPRFLETVLTDLLSLGVANARIKRESYG